MLRLRTQSFRRYRIQGSLPGVESPEFVKALAERRFQPLTEHEERTYGWVSAENLLVTEFVTAEMVKGRYAAFALREDRRRVNARLLRAHLDLELKALRKAAGDGAGQARVSREERRRLREEVSARLLEETSPAVDAWTVLVDPRDRLVYVLSLSKRPNELVRAHFLDTFGVELLPLTPWRRSLELLDDPAKQKRVEEMTRTEFGAPGVEQAADLMESLGVDRVRLASTLHANEGAGTRNQADAHTQPGAHRQMETTSPEESR